jgi:uncharacterized protein YbjT (DUF2867 family)
MNILVTGATGTVGAHVVRALDGRGATQRVLVRDPDKAAAVLGTGIDTTVGDLADPASLARAFDGVDRLFLACGNEPGQVERECAAIDAARDAGVGLVVKLSGPRADVESPLLFERWHGQIERHLVATGLPSVLLHPTAFMTNLLAFAGTIAETGMLFAPAGTARIAFVDPRDVAAAAVAALVEEGHRGRAFRLTGPAAITYEQIAATLSATTGRSIRYVDVPDDAARQSMVEAGLPPMVADAIVAVFASQRAGAMDQVTTGVRTLTGWEPRNFAQFARDHAALFGGEVASRRAS